LCPGCRSRKSWLLNVVVDLEGDEVPTHLRLVQRLVQRHSSSVSEANAS